MYSWGNKRRFNAYTGYLKKIFGTRLQKVSIDAGFTCPNRDGSKGEGGCTFCFNNAFNPSYCDPIKSVKQQILEGIEFHKTRYKSADKYLAYFQAYSNTHGSINKLKEIYEEALSVRDIAGIVIGTRPDCMDEEKLDYFSELSKKTYLVVEYGIESCYDKTLVRVNRGHSYNDLADAVIRTNAKDIQVGGHIIFGFPGETRDEMIAEAGIISALPLNSIKFHQLQIFKETAMGREYRENPSAFHLFGYSEYIDFIIEVVERLNPAIVIERIAGETPPRFNETTGWDLRYDRILAEFEKRMAERDTWQGKMYRNNKL